MTEAVKNRGTGFRQRSAYAFRCFSHVDKMKDFLTNISN